jgi:hypothetical protein
MGYRVRDFSHNYVCIDKKGGSVLHLDLYYLKQVGLAKEEYIWIGREKEHFFPAKFFNTLDTVMFLNHPFKVPNLYKECIEYAYGKNWLEKLKPHETINYNAKEHKLFKELYTAEYTIPILREKII